MSGSRQQFTHSIHSHAGRNNRSFHALNSQSPSNESKTVISVWQYKQPLFSSKSANKVQLKLLSSSRLGTGKKEGKFLEHGGSFSLRIPWGAEEKIKRRRGRKAPLKTGKMRVFEVGEPSVVCRLSPTCRWEGGRQEEEVGISRESEERVFPNVKWTPKAFYGIFGPLLTQTHRRPVSQDLLIISLRRQEKKAGGMTRSRGWRPSQSPRSGSCPLPRQQRALK